MRVAIHGDREKLEEYCEAHGMTIVEEHDGDPVDYHGDCRVLVTDNCSDKNEYYRLKYKLLKRKIELRSTHWCDCAIADFVEYMVCEDKRNRREKHGGRVMFGYRRLHGKVVVDPMAMAVVRRIFKLRDAGLTLKKIAADPDVCYVDGTDLPLSTIQTILKNRSRYESL